MSSKYLNPIKYLGGSALIALVLAYVLPSLTVAIPNDRIRSGVLVQALPFFAAFVCILLTFILIIWLVAARFNGKIPHRTYSAIEMTLIVSILAGVVLLFQEIPTLGFIAYRYAFLLVLGSLLSFLLWSHVVGRSAKADLRLPRFTTRQQIAGVVALVIVTGLMAAFVLNVNAPREPYGIRQRVWNSYDDARRAEIAATATADFNNVEAPFVVVLSMIPGVLFFFAVREAAASLRRPETQASAGPAVSHSTA
ncbi:MAG: hypothetical protein U0670_23895 [Anaerolineae bacterium]